MTLTKLLASDGYICVNKAVMKTFGIATALVLGELCAEYNYWEANNSLEDDDFFYSTLKNLEDETTIKRNMQQKVFDLLTKHQVIEVKRKNMPARRYVKINEDKLFDFLSMCSNVSNDTNNCNTNINKSLTSGIVNINNSKINTNKHLTNVSTNNCTQNENENLQFTLCQQTSLLPECNQVYTLDASNNNNINNNKNKNKYKLKDKSFSLVADSDNSENSSLENFDSTKQDLVNQNVSNTDNINLNNLSNFNSNNLTKELINEREQNSGVLNDLTKNDLTKEETKPSKTKQPKPYKLKTVKETKEKKTKKSLGNAKRQFELVDIYFNNGETSNHPDIAELIKKHLQQRLKKIGVKNYSDTRWENQLQLLIDNAEGDFEYMKEIINIAILNDYNNLTFPDQKKSLQRKSYMRNNNNFDTAKDNVKNKGVALLTEEERKDYEDNSLAKNDDGTPMLF